VLPQEDPDVLLVALLLQPFEEREDAYVTAHLAVQQLAADRGLERAPRRAGIGAQLARRFQQQLAARFVARLGPGVDRPFEQAAAGIRDHQRLVVLQHRAEPVAAAAGTPRRVEREEQRG